MVVNGKADIMLGNSIVMTTNRYLSKYASLMPVMTVSMEIPVGFGISKKCPPEVLSIFNKSIQKLDAGALDKVILDNSIVKHRALDWREFIKKNFIVAGTVFFAVLALSFTGIFLFLKNRQQARFNNSLAEALAADGTGLEALLNTHIMLKANFCRGCRMRYARRLTRLSE